MMNIICQFCKTESHIECNENDPNSYRLSDGRWVLCSYCLVYNKFLEKIKENLFLKKQLMNVEDQHGQLICQVDELEDKIVYLNTVIKELEKQLQYYIPTYPKYNPSL